MRASRPLTLQWPDAILALARAAQGEEKWTIVGEDGDDKDHLGRPKRGLDPRHPLLWADRLEVTFVPKFTPPIANRLGLVEEEGVGQEGAEAISA